MCSSTSRDGDSVSMITSGCLSSTCSRSLSGACHDHCVTGVRQRFTQLASPTPGFVYQQHPRASSSSAYRGQRSATCVPSVTTLPAARRPRLLRSAPSSGEG
jgi:hypothetical protein